LVLETKQICKISRNVNGLINNSSDVNRRRWPNNCKF